MKRIRTAKVSTKLALGFGTIVALLVTMAATAILNMSNLHQDLQSINDDLYPKTVWANDIIDNVNVIAVAMRNMVILKDKAAVQQEAERIQSARKVIVDRLEKLQKSDLGVEGKAKLNKVIEARQNYLGGQEQILKAVAAERVNEAAALLVSTVSGQQNAYLEALAELLQELTRQMEEKNAQAESAAQFATTVLLALSAIAVAVGAGAAIAIARDLTYQLGGEPAEAAAVARQVAQGDLVTPVPVKPGDTTSLMAALANMQRKLQEVITTVRVNAENVATASAQIAQGNQDLSQRTEEQASSLQQTAASMEQLSSTVRQNADNARQANQLAQGATRVAVEGGEVVAEVVSSMKGINDSSRKIADIIGVIDGIAFQTNILALNAAVEAARAGEQGRGFAVVAGEVRSLAQRSAQAAKEIKSLITASVEQVEQGTALVDKAGATMHEVVDAIKRVTDLMAEISAASAEQSTGVSQVGDAVSQMDQVTQQNAALVEESAAAAESLRSQAQQLLQAVAAFKLAGHHAGAAVAAVATAKPVSSASSSFKARGKAAPGTARPAEKPAKPSAGRASPGTPATQPATKPSPVPATAGGDDWTEF